MSANPSLNYNNSSPAPTTDWGHLDSNGHAVQFYEDDAVLLEELSRSIGSALGAGDAGVVIATKSHRNGLAERLKNRGLSLGAATKQGRYIALDAAETLSKFVIDGRPEVTRFTEVIGGIIAQANAAAKGKRVLAFGEMVALLWAEGKAEAAIRVEQLWNHLAQTHSFNLHCAYPIAGFRNEADGEPFRTICAQHSRVIPSESYSLLLTEDDRLRNISLMQQKAQAFQAVAEDRQRLAMALSVEVGDLRRLHELATRITWLDPQQLMRDVISAVAALQNTDMGLLSLRDPEHNDLTVGASIGLPAEFLRRIERVAAGDGACGICLATRERVVIEDTQTDPRFSSCVELSRLGGFRAVHSTPLLDRSGNVVGVLSAQFRSPHRPSDRELRLTDLYARLAVNAIENARLYREAQDEMARRKEAQTALIQAEKLAATGRLAATIAHEINNPLEAVTNFIFLAKSTPDLSDKVRRHLDLADQELSRVSHIAQQTLGFYRGNSNPVWLSVADVVADVLAIYERKLRYKDLTVDTNLGPDLTAYTFRGELTQALSNLMANAIHACQEGGRVWIRASRLKAVRGKGHEWIRITVADNGVGMSEEVRQKIFTPFFTTKEQIGNGLGLWTTRNLLEKQGGCIRFRTRQGRNSGTAMSIFVAVSANRLSA